MLKLVKKKVKKPVSLKDHQERRNKILIKRRSDEYGVVYDLSTACRVHESRYGIDNK